MSIEGEPRRAPEYFDTEFAPQVVGEPVSKKKREEKEPEPVDVYYWNSDGTLLIKTLLDNKVHPLWIRTEDDGYIFGHARGSAYERFFYTVMPLNGMGRYGFGKTYFLSSEDYEDYCNPDSQSMTTMTT